MEEKRKRRKEDEDLTSSSKDRDRVSELPQPILHHILSFLPQNEAAQTCLLSKSWFNVWCTRPNVEFREPGGYVDNTKAFLWIMDQTLQRYHRQNLCMRRFVVEMRHVDSELILLLEKWIPTVLMKLGVETFHLTFPHPQPFNSWESQFYYALPSAPVVFGAEFLTELYLSGFRISFSSTDDKQLCLKNLKTLSLNNVYIKDESLTKIMTSCPLVERSDLDHCSGLTTVNVNNLKHFVCVDSGCNINIKDHPSALETIKINFCCDIFRPHHHFPRLKSLYLCHLKLPKELFNGFSCNFPCLEDLELRSCSGLTDVVLSCSIQRLIIVDMQQQIKTITIDAPHIHYFEFSCSEYPLPSVSFARVAASREWESTISVPFLLERSNIDINLNEMLKALRQSRITLNLDCIGYQHVEDITHVGWYEPLVVEHLNLREFDSKLYNIAALFRCLFRIFHPRYMYTRMHPDPDSEIDKLAQFIWKTNLKDVRCYFWQEQLKKLTVEISDHDPRLWLLADLDPRKWRLLHGSCLTVRALAEIQDIKNIRFGFEWRE